MCPSTGRPARSRSKWKPGDGAGEVAMPRLWKSESDQGGYGVPHALVLYADGKVNRSVLRAALGRFNEPPDDGWNWTVEALAMHLLHDLCGITLADCRTPRPRGRSESYGGT